MSIVLHLTKTDNLTLLDANGNPVDLSIEQGADYKKIVIQIPGDLTTVDPNYNPLNASITDKTYGYEINGSIRKNYADLEPNEPPLVNFHFDTFLYDPTTDLTTIAPVLSAHQCAQLPHTNNRKSVKETPIPGNNIYVYDLWLSLTARPENVRRWGQALPRVNLSVATVPTEGILIDLNPYIQNNIGREPEILLVMSLWYFNYDELGNPILDGDNNPIIAGRLQGITESDLALAVQSGDIKNPQDFTELVQSGLNFIDYQNGTIRLLPGTIIETNKPTAPGSVAQFSFATKILLSNQKIASGFVEVAPRVTEPNRTLDWNSGG
jgi:hypothetical protein